MAQKHYVNPDGSYCGSLVDIAPEDAADAKYLLAIEVDSPPPSGDARQLYDLVNMAWIPFVVPPQPYTLQMADFWIRFEDDSELDAFDAAVSVAPMAKDRRAFGVAVFMVSGSTLFNWTKNVLTGSVGAARANAIMADAALSARPAEPEAA